MSTPTEGNSAMLDEELTEVIENFAQVVKSSRKLAGKFGDPVIALPNGSSIEEMKDLLKKLNEIYPDGNWIELEFNGQKYIGTMVSGKRPPGHETESLT